MELTLPRLMEQKLVEDCWIFYRFMMVFDELMSSQYSLSIDFFNSSLFLRLYGSRGFEIDSCRQHGFFILLR